MRRSFVIPASIALTMLSVVPAGAQVGARSSSPASARARATSAVTRVAGFNVVLVLASQQADLSSDGIPSSASKALADLKDFLPYRSYKLLDTQWSVGSTQLTRLRGLANVEYSLAMETNENIPARVAVSKFVLRNAANGVDAETAYQLEAIRRHEQIAALSQRREAVADELVEARKRYAAGSPQVRDLEQLVQGLTERQSELGKVGADVAHVGPIINTSFTMDIGETVVVGTSRLQGDKALIVLLTAVPKK